MYLGQASLENVMSTLIHWSMDTTSEAKAGLHGQTTIRMQMTGELRLDRASGPAVCDLPDGSIQLHSRKVPSAPMV
jgi:hypothetical protein